MTFYCSEIYRSSKRNSELVKYLMSFISFMLFDVILLTMHHSLIWYFDFQVDLPGSNAITSFLIKSVFF